jgi:hypothetical protein
MEKVLKYAKRENHRLLGDAIDKRLELYRKVISDENLSESGKEGAKRLLVEIYNLQKMQVLCDDLEEVEAKRVVDSLSEEEVSEIKEKVVSSEDVETFNPKLRLERLLANRPYPQEKIIKTSVIGNI